MRWCISIDMHKCICIAMYRIICTSMYRSICTACTFALAVPVLEPSNAQFLEALVIALFWQTTTVLSKEALALRLSTTSTLPTVQLAEPLVGEGTVVTPPDISWQLFEVATIVLSTSASASEQSFKETASGWNLTFKSGETICLKLFCSAHCNKSLKLNLVLAEVRFGWATPMKWNHFVEF